MEWNVGDGKETQIQDETAIKGQNNVEWKI